MNFYEDIASDLKARFEMSGYSHSQVRPLPMIFNKKVNFIKDELGGRVMTSL